MRFIAIVKASPDSEAGVMPSEELLAEMGKFNEELVAAGVMEAGEGLLPSSNGVRVHINGDDRSTTKGPFENTRELVAGFWIWKCASIEEATEWAKRCPNPMPGESVIEVRQIFEADDFGDAMTPELRAQEDRLRASVAANEKGSGIPHSTARIMPHLWYTSEAEEAANFYATVFPDSRVDRVTALPNESPSGPAGSVKIVEFTLFNQPFMAMSAGPLDPFNHAISFVVNCDTQDEIDRYWSALLEGGQAEQCGWLRDRYGVCWQNVPTRLGELMSDPDRSKAKRVGIAMLKMVKLDIAGLEASASE